MSAPDKSSSEFFEDKYRADEDPWNFSSDSYEQTRYRTILHALEPGRYRCAFEPGCSVGALTEKLAAVCERVDACDFSITAVEQARQRCQALPGVNVYRASLNDAARYQDYDLIVLSEIGYYFSSVAWQSLVLYIGDEMRSGATLLASHWIGTSTDHILSGDEVHALIKHPALELRHGERHEDATHGGFRLDLWKKSL